MRLPSPPGPGTRIAQARRAAGGVGISSGWRVDVGPRNRSPAATSPSLRSSTAQVNFGRHVPQIQDRRARAS